ncbi:putative ABC transport system ATP-binding protein [Streptococcus henryi]|uniref:Putative ABC transport system ATP-binding protein n=1 Tax=Streptococcus henryi TaxID=439219 RepID=A0A1G6AG91_9STRE|nr:ATP-binding cassette domain-containing protein [Streptococcus henryi]SDB07350.1 putative ABC transport system ATP-binding protein [Streptococcus henryi]
MIILENISKTHCKQKLFIQLNMVIESGEMTAIKGRIGSGKTTLLKILTGLDTSYQGICSIFGNVMDKNDKELANYRLQNIGYIPQDYQLLEHLTCFDNIALPLKFLKISPNEQKVKVTNILNELKITHLKDKYPIEISGGQSQLVAIARALVKEPNIIIGDEPTGALDRTTEEEVLRCLKRRQSEKTCIVIATHSKAVAEKCQKIIELK